MREISETQLVPTIINVAIPLKGNNLLKLKIFNEEIKLFEKVDKTKLMYLMETYKDNFKKETLRKLLYYSKGIKNNVKTCKYSCKKEYEPYGRLYSKNSLQGLPSEVRAFITNGKYMDIDIKNCMPSILINICNSFNIPSKHIQEYCDKRSEILSKYSKMLNVNEGTIKEGIISLLFGMSMDNLEKSMCKDLEKYPYFQNIKDESLEIYDKILLIPNFQEIINKLDKEKEKCSKQTKISYIIQTIENNIILTIKKYLEKNGFIVGSLIFDGLLVETKEINLEKVQNYIKDKTGFSITLVNKKMVHPSYEFKENLNDNIISSDKNGALKLIEKVKNIIVKDSNNCFWIKNENLHIWEKNEEYKNDLMKVLSEMNLLMEKSGELINVCENLTSARNILTYAIAIFPTSLDFLNKLFNSNLGKIAFTNGYYDCIKGFIKWEECSEDVMFVYNTNREYEDVDITKGKEFFESIIPEGDEHNFFIQALGRGLFGFFTDKRLIELFGMRNSGKSLIADALKSCFGNYVQPADAKNFICNKNKDSDPEKGNAWLVKYIYCRLVFSSEIPTDSLIDGATRKTLFSGGDEIIMRIPFSKQSFSSRIQCLFVTCFNEKPESNQNDSEDTSITITTPFKFVSKEDKLKNFLGLKNYKIGDENIKFLVKNDVFLVKSIISYIFKNLPLMKPEIPEILKLEREEDENENENNDHTKIKSIFDLTLDKDDILSVKDVNLHFMNLGMNKKKGKLILKSLNLYEACRRVDGSVIKVYVGIKLK